MELSVGGLKTHYEEIGQGSVVLLLHGWGGQVASMWPIAQSLAVEHRVIVPDFPGFGTTDTPPEPWSVTEYMQWTVALMAQLNINGCDIIGHSFGGRVGILLSATHRENVRKLVLVDSAGIIPRRSIKYYYKVYFYKSLKKIGNAKCVQQIFPRAAKALKERLLKRAGSKDYQALSEEMKKTFVRVVNQDLKSYLSKIKASTLLIWGSEDKVTPLSYAKIMEKEIPDAGLVVLQGAGHYSYLDQLVSFNTIVAHFLRGTKP